MKTPVDWNPSYDNAPERQRVFVDHAKTRRHSAQVRFLRWALPVLVVLGGVGGLVFTWLEPLRNLGAVTLGPVSLSGTRVTMEQPKITGFRPKDSKPYEMTAESAAQDVRNPNVVEMKGIKARVSMDEGLARLEADSGVYNTADEKIQLNQNVRLRTDSGYDARLKSARADFKAGSVVSDEAVRVDFSGGSIDADRLQVGESGKHMTFEGHVIAVLEPAQTSDQKTQP